MKIFHYTLPPPFREGFLVEIDGGWGEVCPLPGRNKETLQEAYQQLQDLVLGKTVQELLPSVAFGIETAKMTHRELAIPCAALLMGDAKAIFCTAEKAKKLGFNTVKLKGASLPFEETIEIIQELKKHFRLRIDANRSWTLETALRFCSFFSPENFDFIEEPLQNPDALSDFPFPFALDDESLTEENLSRASAVVLKPTVLGNKWRRYASLAQEKGVRIVLSSSFESGIGIARIASLASQLNPFPVGLGTHLHLQQDLLEYPLRYAEGRLVLPPILKPKRIYVKRVSI